MRLRQIFRVKTLIKLTIGIIVIVIAIRLIGGLIDKSNENRAAHAFAQYTLGGNAEASYNLFTASAKNITDRTSWTNTVNRISFYYKGQKLLYSGKTTSSGHDLFVYTIVGMDKNFYRFSILMDKGSGKWLVASFSNLPASEANNQ